MFFANGTRQISTTTTATIERSSRLRSSIRCDMKVSCAPSGGGGASVIEYAGGSAAIETRQRSLARQVGCLGGRWRCGRQRWGRACPVPLVDLFRRRRRRIELRLNAADSGFDFARHGADGGLDLARRGTDLLLQLLQFLELHFAVDVGLD